MANIVLLKQFDLETLITRKTLDRTIQIGNLKSFRYIFSEKTISYRFKKICQT